MNKAAPSGVPPDERIAPIDILRGLALFGVLAVNVVTEFRVSIFAVAPEGRHPGLQAVRRERFLPALRRRHGVCADYGVTANVLD